MSVLDIVLYPDAPLNDRAEPISEFGPALVKLANDMIETMRAEEGVGLAAPQVGLAKRVFVMCPPDGQPRCVVNPELSEMEGREEGEEGCLSMPGIYATNVPRATRVRVQGMDELGQPVDFIAEDFEARIVQHEFDHLNGILFPERLDILTREDVYREWLARRAQMVPNFQDL